uniref:Ig-like domain-containing protein n=1 Tax=Erpetoichthys calabaricus TaxID=27687 RepID=A0A8C4S705_ERPCA
MDIFSYAQSGQFICSFCFVVTGVKVVVNEGFHEGQITINKSEALSLSCKVENTEEEEWLEWYREKDMVSLNANNQKNSSRLCVYPVTESDNQVTFTCCLKRHTEINASVVLNVQFATTLSGEENVTGERGREISFNCDIWANPQVKVHWFKDEESIDLITGSYQLYQDGKQARMTIPKVMDSHKASYKCLAISEVHGNATRIFHLTVKGTSLLFLLSFSICSFHLATMYLFVQYFSGGIIFIEFVNGDEPVCSYSQCLHYWCALYIF